MPQYNNTYMYKKRRVAVTADSDSDSDSSDDEKAKVKNNDIAHGDLEDGEKGERRAS